MSRALTTHEGAADTPLAWVLPGLLAVVLALRLLQLAFSGASLHVDEAQYWDWSRQLQAGYHSKPPLIAWLIAASTALFGESEIGVRALNLLCWPAAAAALGWLAADIAGDTAAAAWVALVWLATPLAGTLGLVATTDGPLVLLWSLALLMLWLASVRARPWAWWALGLVLGLGLLAKYTMAALLVGAWLFVLHRRRRPEWIGVLRASTLALLLLLPHLAWSVREGWVTLRHTADITLHADAAAGRAGGLQAVAALLGGQALALAPLLLPWCLWGRRPRAAEPATHLPWRGLLAWTSAPLLLAGLLQAWRSGVQMNWLAPAHLALALWLGLAIHAASARGQRRAGALLLLQAVLVAGLTLLPAWAAAQQRLLPPWADAWARMRGWGEPLRQFVPVLHRHPAPRVLTASRSVMAQAAYHWRGQGLARLAWAPGGPARHHYESACPWRPGQPLPTHVLLDEPPAAALQAALGPLVAEARAAVPLTRSRTRELVLWRVVQAPPQAPAGAACR